MTGGRKNEQVPSGPVTGPGPHAGTWTVADPGARAAAGTGSGSCPSPGTGAAARSAARQAGSGAVPGARSISGPGAGPGSSFPAYAIPAHTAAGRTTRDSELETRTDSQPTTT
ncbi:hypothetical protein E1809_10850 [Arthrobacter terricola]|uniref:Uncharacterized protein n=1 Tax=Arthrobacter terricola TaxID=2547396 RepID=A0A4R5KNA5_9MICC|nr:hypothetical protein E1809_10850 [Arthrobacter terricola]